MYLFLMALICFACGQEVNPPEQKEPDPVQNEPADQVKTFTNPLLTRGADPWVIQKDGYYYYTHTNGKNIELRSARKMEDLADSDPLVVWQPEENQEYSRQLWAPELHYLDGKWYVYFAASYDSGEENSLNENRRMFVIENESASPMNTNWVFRGKITDETDHWAIDGSVLDMETDKYFIWSGWRTKDHPSNTGRQQLYIARMTSPWMLEGERVMISEPEHGWERNGLVNEGPVILRNKAGTIYLVYSASGCWTDDYKLGILTLAEGGDPLDPAAWTKHPNPVFTKSIDNKVYAPGHNSFFKSPDGSEDWILYHANDNPGDGCGSKRSPRIQKFTWTSEGFPVFGVPVSTSKKLTVPSGEND